jgi:hypothetical protein
MYFKEKCQQKCHDSQSVSIEVCLPNTQNQFNSTQYAYWKYQETGLLKPVTAVYSRNFIIILSTIGGSDMTTIPILWGRKAS